MPTISESLAALIIVAVLTWESILVIKHKEPPNIRVVIFLLIVALTLLTGWPSELTAVVSELLH